MSLNRLLQGFADFRLGYWSEHRDLYAKLATEGQSPETLVIACADARVDPGILTRSQPGDLFTIRNVAAMVPPYTPDSNARAASAAIEFAVRGLGVGEIVVLGHALCGGVRALVQAEGPMVQGYEFLGPWIEIGRDARNRAVAALGGRTAEEVQRGVEQANVLSTVANLMTFPWIVERVREGKIALHGWWFDLQDGWLHAYDPTTLRFEEVRGVGLRPAVSARPGAPAEASPDHARSHLDRFVASLK